MKQFFLKSRPNANPDQIDQGKKGQAAKANSSFRLIFFSRLGRR
jgi:hypothetical protein